MGKVRTIRIKCAEAVRQIVGMIDDLVNQLLDFSHFCRLAWMLVREIGFQRLQQQ